MLVSNKKLHFQDAQSKMQLGSVIVNVSGSSPSTARFLTSNFAVQALAKKLDVRGGLVRLQPGSESSTWRGMRIV